MHTRILSVFNFLKRVGFALLLLGIFCAAANADTTWVSGNVNGVWSITGSPYIIQDTVTVLPEDSLLVTEGVEIIIQDSLSAFRIGGYCHFRGTETDSIYLRLEALSYLVIPYVAFPRMAEFICDYVDISGIGIVRLSYMTRFEFNHSTHRAPTEYYSSTVFTIDTILYSNSRIEPSFYFQSSYFQMDNCSFVLTLNIGSNVSSFSNTVFDSTQEFSYSLPGYISITALGDNARASLENCEVRQVLISGGNVQMHDCIVDVSIAVFATSFEVRNCDIGQKYEYYSLFSGTGTVSECVIHHRIHTRGSSSVNFINNTIIWDWPCRNERPYSEYEYEEYIFSIDGPGPVIKNNIITTCQGYVKLFTDTSAALTPAPSYNLIYGMEEPWRGYPQGPGNIVGQPLFAPNSEDYELLYTSPAIDAGDPSLTDPDGTRSDIGARFWDHRYDHAPILLMPHEVTTGWGGRLHIPFTAVDEQPVKWYIRSELPRWLNRYRLTGPDPLEVNCIVPYGAESFQLVLSTLDRVNRTVIDTIQVNIEPYSVLRDSVSGVLRRDHSPYFINNADAIVPAGDTLIIEPGVEIIGQGNNETMCMPSLTVYGVLQAVGTEQDSIIIRQADEVEDFRGLLVKDSTATAHLSYFRSGPVTRLYFQDCGRVECDHSTIGSSFRTYRMIDSLLIDQCSFVENSGFAVQDSRYLVQRTLFDGGESGLMVIDFPNGGRGQIIECMFRNLGYELQFLGDNVVTIERCLFENNTICVLLQSGSRYPPIPNFIEAHLLNNTFVSAHGEFVVMNFSSPTDTHFVELSNNIFQQSDDAVFYLTANNDTSGIVLRNNCFSHVERIFYVETHGDNWPSIGALAGVNLNGDSVDIYDNLTTDPLFADDSYHLSAESPCIDAGFDYGISYFGLAPDIGYWEYHDPLPPMEDHNSPQTAALTTFPNPFNSTLSISLDVPLHQEVTVSLYDLLGREVDVIYHGKLDNSTLSYTAPPTLASGIYFLNASTSTQTQMRKVVLLK